MFGTVKVVDPSDPEKAYLILTPSELEAEKEKVKAGLTDRVNDIGARLSAAQRENTELRRKIQEIEEETRRQYRKEISELRTAADAATTEAAELREELAQAEEELGVALAKNENFLRINRERSNADRRLQPKKERPGYVLLSQESREVTEKTKYSLIKATVWESVIQTPYEATVDIDDVWMMMEDELESLCLDRLGLTWLDIQLENAVKEQGNVLYNIEYKANYRAGYWNIILFHTRPLRMIPADFIA